MQYENTIDGELTGKTLARSDPVIRNVKTAPLPRGNTGGVISDVIELD